mmetsp:Transcript_10338/g.19369  ORF Transcript_10338/g.19369 Transcript_10338/m.19369 type:complete len:231 (-) Transcript_10338:107-799(-)
MAAYLRSHVTPGADASRHLKILRLGHDPADSEVRDLQLPVLCQEQIHGLEVPVDHVPVMKKAQCPGDGHTPIQNLPQSWAPAAALPALRLLSVVALKVTTGHEFGDAHDRQARLEASANEHDQVWVPHGRQEVDLMHQLIRDLLNAGILLVVHGVLTICIRLGAVDLVTSSTFYHDVCALPPRHVETALQGLAQLLFELKVPAGEHPMTVTATARQLPAAQLASFFCAQG